MLLTLMSNETHPKISDWVKTNSSVTKVAEDLGKSRPTIYKMMEMYDEGMTDTLPTEVVAYFDKKLAENESETIVQLRSILTKKMLNIREEMDKLQSQSTEILKEKSILLAKYAKLSEIVRAKKNDPSQKENEMKMMSLRVECVNLERKLDESTLQLENLTKNYEKCRNELAFYDSSIKSKILDTRETFPIQTTCTIEGDRCMITHNGKTEIQDYLFHLLIYSKVGEEYIFLKEYLPEKIPQYEQWGREETSSVGANYFILEEFLLSAPLYYKIIGYNHKEYTYDEENTSGMRPLKQSH